VEKKKALRASMAPEIQDNAGAEEEKVNLVKKQFIFANL
jgi:hypothetical protein